jgi:hypothetical protein
VFTSLNGSKAQYHYLTLLVVSEFNEWRVLLRGPEVIIAGTRQFSEAKAQDHAVAVARSFVHEHNHDDLPVVAAVEWSPIAPGDWLSYRP